MLKSRLCDYSDACILLKGTITIPTTAVTAEATINFNKKVIFKNCPPFTDWMSEISNTQIDSAQDFDVVMSMYNLIEYNDNYSETFAILWQYCRDEPAVNDDCAIVDIVANNTTSLFKTKKKTTGETDNDVDKKC